MASFDEDALAVAGDQPDAGMIAAAERVAAVIEGGGVAPSDAFADGDVTIIENFPPYVFDGAGAVERWSEQMRAHLTGVTALRHTFGRAQDFRGARDEVYFSLPTTWRGLKHGRPFVEDGGWSFVLARQGGLWRVRGYGWAVTGFSWTHLSAAGKGAPEIVTDRLRIDDLVPGDAPALFDYRSDPEVARFQSWSFASVEETRAFIVRNASSPFGENGAWYQLAVRSAATGELVGDLGVHFLPQDDQQVEIGFTIAPAHQRQGFGKAAVIALIDYLFTVLGKHRVIASVDPRNEASMALLRKVGMRQEAHFRQSLLWQGEWVDDVVFALLRPECENRPAGRRGGLAVDG
ncbi:MAG TPA: GNAT family protein [Caulobacteraceae bacterium]|nr:GNAT family protein [Caulobacteraceae bacterium]